MKLFDSHAHLCDNKFDEDRDLVISNLASFGVTNCIECGYNLDSSINSIELSNKYDFIYSVIGISPNDIPQDIDKLWKDVKEISNLYKRNSKKIVAIGEIGLDYYWNKENKDIQKELFKRQIEIANNFKLPIVIHSRDAWIDTIDILKENVVIKKGVFHCCALNMELVRNALDIGFYISFAGPITFKNSKNAEDIVKFVPLDRMLIETDSPYLSPEPNRGKRNDPSNVKFVAEKIAQFKNISIEEDEKVTRENIERIFEIKS